MVDIMKVEGNPLSDSSTNMIVQQNKDDSWRRGGSRGVEEWRCSFVGDDDAKTAKKDLQYPKRG